MSMSFCSGRPHSVRAPKRLPGELLRHYDSLIHKQKHKSALSHIPPLFSMAAPTSTVHLKVPNRLSGRFCQFLIQVTFDLNPSSNLLNNKAWMFKMGQTETRFLFSNVTPSKKCSSRRTFHLLKLCEKEFMHEAGDGNGPVLMRRTVNQNDGLCRGHLVFQPIANNTQLILTLIDRKGRRCLVQPFWVSFPFLKKLIIQFFV